MASTRQVEVIDIPFQTTGTGTELAYSHPVALEAVQLFEVTVQGKQTTGVGAGDRAHWYAKVIAKRVSGTVSASEFGTTVANEDNAAFDFIFAANDTAKTVEFSVKGPVVGAVVEWHLHFRVLNMVTS